MTVDSDICQILLDHRLRLCDVYIFNIKWEDIGRDIVYKFIYQCMM